MKWKKTKNYQFEWDAALHSTGNSGIKLQYAHSRLCNLLKTNAHLEIPQNLECINWDHLAEPEALKLILRLAQFDENLAQSYKHLEPCILVKYLFELCNDSNKATKVLKVKGTNEEIAIPRFILFQVTRVGFSYLNIKIDLDCFSF